MEWYNKLLETMRLSRLKSEYNHINQAIVELHDDIDNMSVTLGKMISRKCEIELELDKLEDNNELS